MKDANQIGLIFLKQIFQNKILLGIIYKNGIKKLIKRYQNQLKGLIKKTKIFKFKKIILKILCHKLKILKLMEIKIYKFQQQFDIFFSFSML